MGDYSNLPNDVAIKMRDEKIANMEYDIRTVLSVFSRELVRKDELWERDFARYTETMKETRTAYDHYYEEREKREEIEGKLYDALIAQKDMVDIIYCILASGFDLAALLRKEGKLLSEETRVIIDGIQRRLEANKAEGTDLDKEIDDGR